MVVPQINPDFASVGLHPQSRQQLLQILQLRQSLNAAIARNDPPTDSGTDVHTSTAALPIPQRSNDDGAMGVLLSNVDPDELPGLLAQMREFQQNQMQMQQQQQTLTQSFPQEHANPATKKATEDRFLEDRSRNIPKSAGQSIQTTTDTNTRSRQPATSMTSAFLAASEASITSSLFDSSSSSRSSSSPTEEDQKKAETLPAKSKDAKSEESLDQLTPSKTLPAVQGTPNIPLRDFIVDTGATRMDQKNSSQESTASSSRPLSGSVPQHSVPSQHQQRQSFMKAIPTPLQQKVKPGKGNTDAMERDSPDGASRIPRSGRQSISTTDSNRPSRRPATNVASAFLAASEASVTSSVFDSSVEESRNSFSSSEDVKTTATSPPDSKSKDPRNEG